ncbi:MAG TPA: RsmD family RNA methyltransferase [Acidimicrobiales bacterium]|nr:RsmD family RNA methyltransferase [Acidimicrobiales bacterium]
MRVVAGTARGRRLVGPRGSATRPTSDRVREAVFDILASLEAAGAARVGGAEVVDLYAGTGAMGIEALSRGAAGATFVETDPAAVLAIETNLAATGLGPGHVVRRDVDAFLRSGAVRSRPGPFDLAFCDPPYGFEGWDDLLAALPARLVVAEAGAPIPSRAGRPLIRSRRYGGTVVELLGEPER